MLSRLEASDSYDQADELGPINDALRLSAALSQPWVYAGSDAADYSLDAMARAGRADGSAAPPVPDSSESALTQLESKLIASFETWCTEVYDTFKRFDGVMQTKLRRLESVIKQMDSARNKNAKDPAENFYAHQISGNSRAETVVSQVRDRFAGPFTMFLEKRNFFMAFRAAHGIHRNPSYEASILAFVFIAIICIVFETAVNGFMYGQASDLGLIGGWGVAAGLSIIIFGSSFLAGWVLTLKNGLVQVHQPIEKGSDRMPAPAWRRSIRCPLVGWVGWLILTAMILLLIAFVCVYRDEAATLVPDSGTHPMSESISRVMTLDLLPRADIEGLLLIFVNLAIMLIGMYKGYTHFDRVPNYKSHAEELARAREELRNTIEEAKQDLGLTDQQTRFEERLKVYTNAEIDKLVHRYADGVAALKQLHHSCDVQIARTERDCNDRLMAYRKANAESRPKPYPTPLYFDEPWNPPSEEFSYSPSELPILSKASWIDAVDTAAIMDALEEHRSAAIEMLVQRTRERYSEEISKYVRESDMDRHEVNYKDR